MIAVTVPVRVLVRSRLSRTRLALALALAWACACAWTLAGCATATAPHFVDLASHGGGHLYGFGTQRVLVLRGSHYEMGLQHGRALASEVRTVVRETLTWTYAAGLSRAELAAISAQTGRHIPAHLKEEMRGLAEGSGASLRDIQLLHAMPSRFHCSGAAVTGSMTRDGRLYHSRSLDYALNIGVKSRIQNHALLIARFPTNGHASVVPAWAGFLGAVTGMNAAGISVGEMGSASADESFDGLPMIFTIREVLRRSTSLEQAIDIFETGPRTGGFNYIVGSGDEDFAVAIEVTRHHFFVSRMGGQTENVPPHHAIPDAIVRTNHFVGRATAETQPRRAHAYHPENYRKGSWLRYQMITQHLEAHRGTLDAPAMIDLLRRYPPEHACLHQAVMCPTTRTLWVSQAIDDRTSQTPGAQNQPFYAYHLTPKTITPTP